MNIQMEQNKETVVLSVAGRLDTTSAPVLEKTIQELPAEVTALELNLKELTYISSAGLRILLGAQKKMNQIGRMKLTHVCESVLEILEMTGFADILTIE